MIKVLFRFVLIFFVLSLPAVSSTSSLSTPPSTIKLKLPPPKSRTEAIKRIPDFIILNTILPPVIDRKKLMKQVFGSYTQEVKKFLTDRKMKELSSFAALKMKSGKFNLSSLKRLILNKLGIKPSSDQQSSTLPIPVIAGVLVAIIVPLLMLFFFII